VKGESKWFLGKMNGPLEEEMKGVIACDKFVCVWCQLLVSSHVTRVSPPWLMTLPGGALWQLSSFWRICLEADEGSSEKASPCICFSKCLQPQITNIQYIWGGMSKTPTVIFWGGTFWGLSLLNENSHLLFLLILWVALDTKHTFVLFSSLVQARTC